MKVSEFSFKCPTCNQEMGLTDLSFGEDETFVVGLYCFQCRDNVNFGFTLEYARQQFRVLAQKRVPLRPPLLLPPAEIHYTAEQDVRFLTALRIKAD